ncbi:MAG: pyridoxal phosphate biosynthetic protein [Erythrobacter sp.]
MRRAELSARGNQSEPLDLTPAQKGWALAAALLFLASIGLLGFALSNQVFIAFALGWVALQIFGYGGSLKRAKGDFNHPLFKSQVMLHGIAMALLLVLLLKGPA